VAADAPEDPAGAVARVGVIGLGNVLMGDDAFGPWVVQTLLAGYAFPEDVAVQDLGTPGLDLIPYVTDLEALVLVDTVRSEAAPGTLRLYRRDEILEHPPQTRLSPHDPGVKEALLTAEFAGRGPREVLLVGAVPETTAMGVRLSPPMREAVPGAVAEVLKELERLGRRAEPRKAPLSPDIWWACPPGIGPAFRGGARLPDIGPAFRGGKE
jgi:hydrogenase maturation protease